MMPKIVLIGFLIASSVPSFGSELPRGCFRSLAEAVGRAGAGSSAPLRSDNLPSAPALGYRLVDVRRDALRNRSWAMVESCGHPEQPAIAVEVPGTARMVGAEQKSVTAGRAVVIAGSAVRLIRSETNVRLEVAGVAQGNGAVGERVRVRVLRASDGFQGTDAEQQVLIGVVRSADVLEME